MQIRRVVLIAVVLCLTQIVFASGAFAAPAANTIGWAINNFIESSQNFTRLLAAMSYIGGTYLAVNGTLKFKGHVDNPMQIPLSAPIKRLGAGGCLLALPFMMRTVYTSLFGDSSIGSSAMTISTRTNATLTPGTMEDMIFKFMQNIGGPVEALLKAFCYFSAIAILMVGISRLTKKAEDGPRGPGGAGTITCFIVAGALIAFGDSAGSFSTSIFGDSQIKTNAQISTTVMSNGTERAKVETVIEALMSFVMIVGYIAFIRGWFVLKNFADGNQNATIAQGLTFLIGGTLAINLGDLINFLQNSLGLTSGALTFG